MKLLLIIPFALTSLVSFPSWGANLDKGLKAYFSEDYESAIHELMPIAEQGHPVAQFSLGMIYARGVGGVLQDFKTAIKWWKLSSAQGFAHSQGKLAYVYLHGKGVPEDYVYAHMWANIAASNGSEDAIKIRDFVSKRMTPSQLEKAQDLARECVAKNYKGC